MPPEDFRDAFSVAGGAFGRPWIQVQWASLPEILQIGPLSLLREDAFEKAGSTDQRTFAADWCMQIA